MRVLCFTTSYNRLKFLRECIFSIKNQTYTDITHSVNVAYDNVFDISLIKNIISDIDYDDKLKVVFNLSS